MLEVLTNISEEPTTSIFRVKEDEGSRFIWNTGKYLQQYMKLHEYKKQDQHPKIFKRIFKWNWENESETSHIRPAMKMLNVPVIRACELNKNLFW